MVVYTTNNLQVLKPKTHIFAGTIHVIKPIIINSLKNYYYYYYGFHWTGLQDMN